MHPHFHNRKVLAWCDAHGIAVTAYMPLGLGRVLSTPALAAIAARTVTSPAQVALAWLIQQGVIVIPASKSRAHMEANLTAADITLSDAEMAAMARDRPQPPHDQPGQVAGVGLRCRRASNALPRHKRSRCPTHLGKDHSQDG